MISVMDQIDSALASQYNIGKYFRNTGKWDKLVQDILAIEDYKEVAIQIDSRLDIISYNEYGTSQLDWVIMIYNKVKSTSDIIPGEIMKCPDITSIGNVLNSYDRNSGLSTNIIGFTRL